MGCILLDSSFSVWPSQPPPLRYSVLSFAYLNLKPLEGVGIQLGLSATFVTEPSSAFSSEICLNVLHHLRFVPYFYRSSSPQASGVGNPYLILSSQFNNWQLPSEEEWEWESWSCMFCLLANSLGEEGVERISGLLCASFLWIQISQRYVFFIFLHVICVSVWVLLLSWIFFQPIVFKCYPVPVTSGNDF